MRLAPGDIDRLLNVWLGTFVALLFAFIIVALRKTSSFAESIAASIDKLGLSQGTLGRLALLVGLGYGATFLARHVRHKLRVSRLEPGADLMSFSDLKVVENAPVSYLGRTQGVMNRLATGSPFDAILFINELFSAAYSVGASDIHISPQRELTKVFLRVDGVLHELCQLGPARHRQLVNRIKVLSRLSIHVHAKPQDGAISFDSDELQLRVSTLPTNHGEKVVVRLAVRDEQRFDLNTIGFSENVLTLYKTVLARDHGVIYLTGPTGSGKTTTLYASMTHIRRSRGDTTNMVTLEDPIEFDLDSISQTQIEPEAGLTFAVGLRSVLRQDPDVIMVGEIRDEETARTAIRAGLTGHLILTTVHADSTVGVFNRLKQLQVERFQLASASVAVVNQRLAIRNCPKCTQPVSLSQFQAKQLEIFGLSEADEFFEGRGCPACGNKGRQGRVPLIEVLPVTDRLRDLLIKDTPTHKLLESAVEEGMITLASQAVQRARMGEIPFDEVIRVLSVS